jgi:hypothetical protein
MPYAIPQKKMVVFFSPKAGGTSIRDFLFQIENGHALSDITVQGAMLDANSLVKNLIFRRAMRKDYSDYRRFAMVRDPVTRFLSGYSNRVQHYRELSDDVAGDRLKLFKLPADPDLKTFVSNIDDYKRVSRSIDRHFSRQQWFIGDDPDYYERIFRLDRISEFVSAMNSEFGGNATMNRLQTGGDKLEFETLERSTRRRILKICETDIAFQVFPDILEKYS